MKSKINSVGKEIQNEFSLNYIKIRIMVIIFKGEMFCSNLERRDSSSEFYSHRTPVPCDLIRVLPKKSHKGCIYSQDISFIPLLVLVLLQVFILIYIICFQYVLKLFFFIIIMIYCHNYFI